MKKGVIRNFAKFTGKHLCQSLLFNKVAGLRPTILLKKRLWHSCFPVNFAKFLRTPFLQNTFGRLLLITAIQCMLFPVYLSLYVKKMTWQVKLHDRSVNFERGRRINGQRGTKTFTPN